jgi:NAD/NADP transhydrogenase beta subunit
MTALGGPCLLQKLHCLSELITIHINISLCGADMMAIVSLLHAFF